MRSCLVLGSGRSGTSLAAGIVADAGYFTGDRHWDATEANPKGFFEDRGVNAINERLLAPLTPWTLPGLLSRLMPRRIGWLQRWLAVVPVDAEIASSRSLDRRMAAATSRRPFCLKDPRFCYTLPAWRPHLGDCVFLCVFRHPAVTLTSLRRELDSAPYLRGLELDDDHLLGMWCAAYSHILDLHHVEGEWLFAHYDQVLSGACLAAWSAALGVELSSEFAEPELSRSSAGGRSVPAEALEIYARLRALADYRDA